MRKKPLSLSAAEQKLMESLLMKRVSSLDARPAFRQELHGTLMRELAFAKAHAAPAPLSLVHSFFRLSTIAAVMVIVVVGSGFTTAYAYASPSVTRATNLYVLKRTVEQLQLLASPDAEQRSRLHIKLAERRLEEAKFLADRGEIDPLTLEAIVSNVEEAHALAQSVSDPRLKNALDTTIAGASEKQRSILAHLIEQMEGEFGQTFDVSRAPSEVDSTAETPDGVVKDVVSNDEIVVLEKTIGQIGTIELQAIEDVQATTSPSEEVQVVPDYSIRFMPMSEGVQGSRLTASIIVTNGGTADASDGLLTVVWGDGSSDTINAQLLPSGEEKIFAVTHTYARAGSYGTRAEIRLLHGREKTTANNRASIMIVVRPLPDACTAQGERRCKGQLIQECSASPSDGLTWTPMTTCAAGETCSPQGCKAACQSTCSDAYTKACDAEGVRQCLPTPDGCLEWKHTKNCLSDQSCANGVCAARISCGDGMLSLGEECDDGNVQSGDGCSFACRKEACTDTDGGAVFGTKGTVSLGGMSRQSDFCETNKKLWEYSCAGQNNYVSTMTVCSDGCYDGACLPPAICGNATVESNEECDDGNATATDGCSERCVTEPVSSLNMNACLDRSTLYFDQQSSQCTAIHQPCTDPDGGQNTSVRAHAFGFREANNGPRDARIRTGGQDSCLNATTLREHFCAETYFMRTIDLSCPGGCSDGICATAQVVCGNGVRESGEECDDGNSSPNDGCTQCKADFCEDSDASSQFLGGVGNYGLKGTIRGTGGGGGVYTDTDACIDATKLMELGCIGTKTNVTNYTCPYGCENGACKQPTSEACGNGTRESSEQCDDGNTADGDGCTPQCRLPVYEIRNVQISCDRTSVYFSYSRTDEAVLPVIVDEANRTILLKNNVLSPLSADITAPSIGFDMSLLQHGKKVKLCSKNLAVCSPLTTVVSRAGNGVVEPPEECDDGNAVNDDQCSNLCKETNPIVNCAETDGGYDIFTKGTVRLKNGQSSTDGCIDAQKLRENECFSPGSNDYMSFQVECAKGCFDGACKP